jgi:hypothetical protein
MGMKKIIKKIEEYVQDKIDEAYAEGYSDGSNDAYSDHDVGFVEGVKSERERVIGMFKMLAQQELANGSASKAKSYAMSADTVDVANHMEQIDWSEEGIARWNAEENEKDGF